MRRMWPEEFNFVLDAAEEVTVEIPSALVGGDGHPVAGRRKALKVRLSEENCARLWPLAEARYRLDGAHSGKAITLVATNPHSHGIHPADGGREDVVSDSGLSVSTRYVVLHFLLDDVRETATAG